MGRAPRARFGSSLALLALTRLVSSTAAADPLFLPPEPGKARWGGERDDVALVGLLADVRALGVLTGYRLSAWPDRRLGILPNQPQLVSARVGMITDFSDLPLTLVGRVDFAEPSRPYLEGSIGPISGAVVDELYALWRPWRPLQLLLGRARVPFTKARQFDEVDEPVGAPPFVIDRVAPDRRWGLAAFGDLGAASYGGGAYLDADDVEPRERVGDPSAGGALALAAHLEWTPRAPMMGSNPPGRVAGARGPLPTPRSDPWFDTARVSAGAGVLWRVRRDGSRRADASLSAQLKWGPLAALAEGLIASESGNLTGGGYAELMATPIDRLALTVRGEVDTGAPGGGEWTLAGSIGWSVTKDRHNKVNLVGWLRRDRDRGTPYDALVVFLQASL